MARVLAEIPCCPNYYADKNGNIWSGVFKKKKKLKPNVGNTGYYKVTCVVDGKHKTFNVHRLVALTFLPKVHGKTDVNHIDGNKLNNAVDNLEWCSKSENSLHAYRVLKCVSNGGKRRINVLNLDTSQLFSSAIEAAESIDYSLGGFHTCMTNGWRIRGDTYVQIEENIL